MKKFLLVPAFVASMTTLSGCIVEEHRPPPRAVVEAPAPVVVEEGTVAPVVVDQYYVMGGRYYYWHPDAHRYVVLRGPPPRGHREIYVEHLPPHR